MRSDQAPVQYKTGGNVRSVAVADFNGDGKLDIAAYGPGQMESPLIANASVLPGNCNGTVQPAKSLTGFGNGPYSLVVGDFNAANSVTVTAGGANLPLDYAGAQPQFPGLDQVNVPLPPCPGGEGRRSDPGHGGWPSRQRRPRHHQVGMRARDLLSDGGGAVDRRLGLNLRCRAPPQEGAILIGVTSIAASAPAGSFTIPPAVLANLPPSQAGPTVPSLCLTGPDKVATILGFASFGFNSRRNHAF